MEQLQTYERLDISANTDIRVCGNRTYSPWGFLIHTTSGTNSREWLQVGSAVAGHPASADALIERTGKQLLISPPGKYAYHAGQSRVQGFRTYINDEVSQVLLGVELECLDAQTPTWQQYDSLADLMIFWATLYNLRWPLLYYGHYSVARPMGRRSDPVNFDWGTLAGRVYIRALSAKLAGLQP